MGFEDPPPLVSPVTVTNAHSGLLQLPPRADDKPGTGDMTPINMGHVQIIICILRPNFFDCHHFHNPKL